MAEKVKSQLQQRLAEDRAALVAVMQTFCRQQRAAMDSHFEKREKHIAKLLTTLAKEMFQSPALVPSPCQIGVSADGRGWLEKGIKAPVYTWLEQREMQAALSEGFGKPVAHGRPRPNPLHVARRILNDIDHEQYVVV